MKSIIITLALSLTASLSWAQSEMWDICPVKLGEEIPNANVYTQQGETKDLKALVGEQPTVLVVYRGGWCPYCTRHLSALQEVKPEIDSMGYQMIAITPDNFTNLDSTLQSTELDYQLYSDKQINAINALGLGWKVPDDLYIKYKDKYGIDVEEWSGEKHHTLPVPAVFIIVDGKIRYQHIDPNYSQRLAPEVLLAMLKSLAKA